MNKKNSIAACLEQAQHSGIESSDAQILLGFAADLGRTAIIAWPEKELPQYITEHFLSLVNRRANGEPLAYLTGVQEFWSLSLEVNSTVLVPRADTELLVEQALLVIEEIPQPRILELGTGSGAIALALASERADAVVTATDLHENALDVARRNAAQFGLPIDFISANWLDLPQRSATEQFDIIVSNPPYIRDNDEHLSGDGVAHEPLTALVSGTDGLEDLATIIQKAKSFLRPGGWLLLEHGYDQGEAVRELLSANDYNNRETLTDHAGNDRVSKGRRRRTSS